MCWHILERGTAHWGRSKSGTDCRAEGARGEQALEWMLVISIIRPVSEARILLSFEESSQAFMQAKVIVQVICYFSKCQTMLTAKSRLGRPVKC